MFGTIGRAEAAYFEKVNAEGGINGRKITLISLDDAYAPPKTVEQTRKLVEPGRDHHHGDRQCEGAPQSASHTPSPNSAEIADHAGRCQEQRPQPDAPEVMPLARDAHRLALRAARGAVPLRVDACSDPVSSCPERNRGFLTSHR